MMLTRLTPFGELSGFDPFRDPGRWTNDFGLIVNGAGTDCPYPRFDVLDKQDAYEIKADLPGVKREDIQVFLDGSDLEIVADVNREEDEQENGKLVRSERLRGRVHRRLTLAEEPDIEKAKAAYEDGVLKITLPRNKDVKRKQLEVH